MAAGRDARRLVVPRMASRGAGRLSAGRLQRLAAHFAAARQKPGRGVEYFPARCDVCRTAHARLTLQNPRARRQRLARPHSRLCDPRGTGRENQEFHRPVLESGPVRLAGRPPHCGPQRGVIHLRSPRRYGPGTRRRGQLCGIHRKDPAPDPGGGLRYGTVDGHRRTSLLRVVRLPRVELLRPFLALRHARSAQNTRAHGSRTGTCGGNGSSARPLREEPQRGDQRARRHGSSLLPTGYGGRTALLGLQNFRLRQGTGAALSALERQILARRISLRRLSVRRSDLDALPPSRAHRLRPEGAIFR